MNMSSLPDTCLHLSFLEASFSSFLLQLPNILLQATNNVLHLPILFDLAWYVVWAFYIAMAPFYLLCHILFFVLDTLFAIYSFARQKVKSLVSTA